MVRGIVGILRPEHDAGEMRMMNGIRIVLRFQAHAGIWAVMHTVLAIVVQMVARIALHARLIGDHVHDAAGLGGIERGNYLGFTVCGPRRS